MPIVQSVNIGVARDIRTKSGTTGIDKQPTLERVGVSAPGPKGIGGSGLAGDVIVDTANHGGDDQAVYVFAREDLDAWRSELGEVRSGAFGENLTTLGIDVTSALVGARWRVGDDVVLEATGPRIPCATFAEWMVTKGWLKMFTRRARPGAYFRVLAPGHVCVGDTIRLEDQPRHDVTIGLMFRALTLARQLLPELLAASEFLSDETLQRIRDRSPYDVLADDEGAAGS